MTQQQLLMIEDDTRLANMVGEYLRQSGYGFTHAADAASGLAAVQASPPDLVILDLMLPDMDGLEVCRRIKSQTNANGENPSTAVLMLTAKGDPMDRIVGLEIGADDYLPKPFEPRELLARIRAVLRRGSEMAAAGGAGGSGGASQKGRQKIMQFGSLEIDRDARTVAVSGSVRELTSYQFDLLVALAERSGRVLSRDQIMEAVRGRELEAFDRSIDVHMGRIRSAIELDQCQLFRHPIRAVQLNDVAAAKIFGGLFRQVCRYLWLQPLFCGDCIAGLAGTGAGVVCLTNSNTKHQTS